MAGNHFQTYVARPRPPVEQVFEDLVQVIRWGRSLTEEEINNFRARFYIELHSERKAAQRGKKTTHIDDTTRGDI